MQSKLKDYSGKAVVVKPIYINGYLLKTIAKNLFKAWIVSACFQTNHECSLWYIFLSKTTTCTRPGVWRKTINAEHCILSRTRFNREFQIHSIFHDVFNISYRGHLHNTEGTCVKSALFLHYLCHKQGRCVTVGDWQMWNIATQEPWCLIYIGSQLKIFYVVGRTAWERWMIWSLGVLSILGVSSRYFM